ncbi:MAG TPA: hypothetical protein VG028_05205 [Terriglobia bacterium]|nr:hypothetical protein [Terriglobia bacterium]
MKKPFVLLPFALLVFGFPAVAQKLPYPQCFQTSRGTYVEGTLPLNGFKEDIAPDLSKVPEKCWPDRTPGDVNHLIFPAHVLLDVTDPKQLKAYVRVRDKTGEPCWLSWPLRYNQISSLAFGYIPKDPFLTTGQTAIIGTAVSGATSVLSISKGVNDTWKLGLGITSMGIAASVGGAALVRRYGIPPHHYGKAHESYYLVIRYCKETISECQLKEYRKEELKSSQYVPQGEVVVFAMRMTSFWGVDHVLQSRTGLPLSALPTPGASGK